MPVSKLNTKQQKYRNQRESSLKYDWHLLQTYRRQLWHTVYPDVQ